MADEQHYDVVIVGTGAGGGAPVPAGDGQPPKKQGWAQRVLREPRFGLAVVSGSGAFDQAIADFAETYADQNERDYAALQAAVKDGRAEAATEISHSDPDPPTQSVKRNTERPRHG